MSTYGEVYNLLSKYFSVNNSYTVLKAALFKGNNLQKVKIPWEIRYSCACSLLTMYVFLSSMFNDNFLLPSANRS